MVSAGPTLIDDGTLRTQGAPGPPLVPASIVPCWGDPAAAHVSRRNGNPTGEAPEQPLGAVEQAEPVVLASGRAASMARMHVLTPGRERILLPSDSYHNTRRLAARPHHRGAGPILVGPPGLAAIEQLPNRPRARSAAETAPGSLIRPPAGIEPSADLVADIGQSLEAGR